MLRAKHIGLRLIPNATMEGLSAAASGIAVVSIAISGALSKKRRRISVRFQ